MKKNKRVLISVPVEKVDDVLQNIKGAYIYEKQNTDLPGTPKNRKRRNSLDEFIVKDEDDEGSLNLNNFYIFSEKANTKRGKYNKNSRRSKCRVLEYSSESDDSVPLARIASPVNKFTKPSLLNELAATPECVDVKREDNLPRNEIRSDVCTSTTPVVSAAISNIYINESERYLLRSTQRQSKIKSKELIRNILLQNICDSHDDTINNMDGTNSGYICGFESDENTSEYVPEQYFGSQSTDTEDSNHKDKVRPMYSNKGHIQLKSHVVCSEKYSELALKPCYISLFPIDKLLGMRNGKYKMTSKDIYLGVVVESNKKASLGEDERAANLLPSSHEIVARIVNAVTSSVPVYNQHSVIAPKLPHISNCAKVFGVAQQTNTQLNVNNTFLASVNTCTTPSTLNSVVKHTELVASELSVGWPWSSAGAPTTTGISASRCTSATFSKNGMTSRLHTKTVLSNSRARGMMLSTASSLQNCNTAGSVLNVGTLFIPPNNFHTSSNTRTPTNNCNTPSYLSSPETSQTNAYLFRYVGSIKTVANCMRSLLTTVTTAIDTVTKLNNRITTTYSVTPISSAGNCSTNYKRIAPSSDKIETSTKVTKVANVHSAKIHFTSTSLKSSFCITKAPSTSSNVLSHSKTQSYSNCIVVSEAFTLNRYKFPFPTTSMNRPVFMSDKDAMTQKYLCIKQEPISPDFKQCGTAVSSVIAQVMPKSEKGYGTTCSHFYRPNPGKCVSVFQSPTTVHGINNISENYGLRGQSLSKANDTSNQQLYSNTFNITNSYLEHPSLSVSSQPVNCQQTIHGQLPRTLAYQMYRPNTNPNGFTVNNQLRSDCAFAGNNNFHVYHPSGNVAYATQLNDTRGDYCTLSWSLNNHN